MGSEYQYRFTGKAEADLDDIVSYIAVELANPTAARKLIDRLQKTIDEARRFPESGSIVVNDYIPKAEVRKKIVENYIVYYLPDPYEKMITILRIVYGRRNMDEILRKLDMIFS